MAESNHGYRSSRRWLERALVVGNATSAREMLSRAMLPKSFDWRDVNGVSLVTTDVNQHIPQYCGSCWIHGTTAALNDRIKVMRQGKFPDVMLSRQAIMNCVPAPDGHGDPPGCNGGDTWMIHKYLSTNKTPDESCMPYQARNMGCAADTVCRNCLPDKGGCWPVKNWTGYGVSSYGQVSGEADMMSEIYARGPIACSFATDSAFMFNYTQNALKHEGVYVSDKNYTVDDLDHTMEVTGWGETASGIKYWVIRNSWGTYWGNSGWLKLKRGTNQLLSESECNWAVPTFEDLDESLAGRVMGDYVRGISTVSVDGPTQATLEAPNESGGLPSFAMLATIISSFMLGALTHCGFRNGWKSEKSQPLLG
eukprot:TRINITY_DN5948_c0_g1_i2.p1 TRINITY_DN5948_c0_g1~~TRINITY_DN5948_c0_g1_i2.p1  ORF type:complete len:396 (-),score=37.62 TRINITY_DN5948_c0_g1_i2:149-1246(-)